MTVGYVLGAAWELTPYVFRFGWALLLPKVTLAARLLAAKSQPVVALNHAVSAVSIAVAGSRPPFRHCRGHVHQGPVQPDVSHGSAEVRRAYRLGDIAVRA